MAYSINPIGWAVAYYHCEDEGNVWWLGLNVYSYLMAVKSMMRRVLSTPVNDVLLCDVGDIIGRMGGLQDTDTSPWVYIIEWYGD